MRKYVIGTFIGFCLSFAVGAHAEVSSYVGRVIEGAFPVKYNDAPIGDGLVIDGTTYLPVRKLGEAMGLTVLFDAEMGVSLKKVISVTGATYGLERTTKEAQMSTTAPKIIIKNPVLDGEIDLDKADVVKENMQRNIASVELQIRMAKANKRSAEYIAELEKGIQNFKDVITEIERQKAELSK